MPTVPSPALLSMQDRLMSWSRSEQGEAASDVTQTSPSSPAEAQNVPDRAWGSPRHSQKIRLLFLLSIVP